MMAIEPIGEQDNRSTRSIDTVTNTKQNTASQFEAMFLQSILESRCIEQHFKDESSPFGRVFESQLPFEAARRPADCPRDPEISLNAQSYCIGIDRTRSSGQAAGCRDMNQQTLDAVQSADDFVTSIWPYAKQAARMINLDPKLLMAQAMLETGWGKSIIKAADGSSSHNLFNIKATNTEHAVTVNTTEYIAGAPIKMMASFKQYASVEHGFNDYILLISTERYKTALANAHDPERYVQALQDAGYATDPDYHSKIMSIYYGSALQRLV